MDFSTSGSPAGPSSKRARLDATIESGDNADKESNEELEGDHCSICLQLLLDRTLIPECSHEFCFECIVTWTEQSRRCPLCTRTIGTYLIHHIRSNYDYQKYHLPPLRSSPPPIQPLRRVRGSSIHQRPGQERRWGRRQRRDQDVADELERAIDRRRWIYQNRLFAKHVGSNRASRYRPFPTPTQFSASPDYISRATVFIRRELRVWPNLDVEFLTTFILSLMKAIDIRSESAVKLMAEFLDMDCPYREGNRFPNAEHFVHELYSFLRSPYKTLSAYDVNVQYDEPEGFRRRTNHDNKTTSEEFKTNELSAAQSRSRRHSRVRMRLRDGSGRSRSKSGARHLDDRLDGCLMVSAECHGAKQFTSHSQDSSRPSTTPNSGCLSLAGEACAEEMVDENHDSSTSDLDLLKGKGKERATPEGLATNVDHVHGSHNKSSRNEREDVVSLSSANASELVGRSVSVERGNNYSGLSPSYRNSSQSSIVRSRTRNPLLIAQAHLSEGRNKRNSDYTRPPPTNIENSESDLRSASHSYDRPSLLSRISEPKKTDVQTNGSLTELSEHGTEVSVQPGKSIQTVEELRNRLLRRLEAERIAQAGPRKIGKHTDDNSAPQSASSIPSSMLPNGIDGSPSAMVKKRKTADLEAEARARARVKMKLTVAKHIDSSNAHSDNVMVHDSEEKPRVPLKREGILRTVLENRRRGG
ncbi:hypothetical protein ACEPAG_2680 [Sanghuangporus baumii]